MLAVESRISVRVSPGWNRITSTMSLLVLERQKKKKQTCESSENKSYLFNQPEIYSVNSLEQESPGVHLCIGLTGDVKFVGECERNFGFAHQLLVGVVRRKRIFT